MTSAYAISGVPWPSPEGLETRPLWLRAGVLTETETDGARPVDLAPLAAVARPGLVNGHDHLDFGGFPLLDAGAPFEDHEGWAEAVTHRRAAGELRAYEGAPLARRLLASALRNLKSGVTAVAHMNPFLRRVFCRREFPIRVLGQGRCYHSVALGGDLAAFLRKVKERPFMVHACEGRSERARAELATLLAAGAIRSGTVMAHGTALDAAGAARVAASGATLVLCPVSNRTLYDSIPDIPMLVRSGIPLGLGSDSPISGPGDLLEDMAAARAAGMPEETLWSAVGPTVARALGDTGIGVLGAGSPADLVLADGADPRLERGRASVLLVIVAGIPRLARREGVIAAFGLDEKRLADGIWIEGRLGRWCERLGLCPEG